MRRLAPFALTALHDNWSTRGLGAVRFREAICKADLQLGPAELAFLALPIESGLWRPPGLRRRISAELLRGEQPIRRRTKTHGLAVRTGP